jgi:two-component system, OmpR family, sensor kinase
MTRLRIGVRRRLQLAVIGAVAVALSVLIAVFNLVLRERLNHDADNALLARASAELASLHISGQRLAAPEQVDAGAVDTGTWVFAGRTAIEQPRSDARTAHAAALLSAGPRRTLDVGATHTRLYAVPVLANGRRLGTVVAEISLRPYESTAETALIASLVLGGLVLAVVAVAARLAISAALRPVAYMSAQAEAWSEADTGRRFGLGPPRDEITQLAATLDRLLDRVATSLRHEQRFSAELSHELRSPLASIVAEAQLALRHARSLGEHRSGYEKVLASAEKMRRTLDTLVSAARVELQPTRGRGEASTAMHSAARGCEALARERGIDLVIDANEAVRLGVDNDVAERVLAPLIENACRYGRSFVKVAAQRTDGTVELLVSDDGPGIPASDREQIFEPGFSGNGALADRPSGGAGLGLSLARRLARAAGGDVQLSDRGPGAHFVVRLPSG